MQALHTYYDRQTIEKLERLAQLTANKRHTAFGYRLALLDFCALALASVNEAAQLPLNGPEDIATFTAELDKASIVMNQVLDAYFQTPGNGYYRVPQFLFDQGYGMNDIYLEIRAKIRAKGKENLLARLSAKMANQ